MSCDNSNVRTTAGTVIGISAGVPATCDAAGFAALTYTAIGEITDFGEFGRVYAVVTHVAVAGRSTTKRKGSYNEGTADLQLALDRSDAGQIIARQALASDASYAFRLIHQDGTIDYLSGQVVSFTTNVGGPDQILSGALSVELEHIVNVTGFAATYTLTYTAGANGSLLGTSPQTVALGADGGPVAAVANTGFVFDDWSDGSTANPRVDYNVTANKTVTANFVAE